jgi:hypothetical protein
MSEPLIPEREQEIRETQLGNWYDGPWTQGYVEGSGDDPAYYRVKHAESGTTLATLPDWAGPIALFIADAHDAVPELLAELDRVRAERDQYANHLDGIHLAQWENKQETPTEQAAEIDRLRAELAGLRQGSERWAARCDHIAKQGLRWKAEADGRKAHGQKLEAELEQAKARVTELEAAHRDAVRVCEALSRRLSEEMVAGSGLYAALTMPTTPDERQAALDKFTATAQQIFNTALPTDQAKAGA